MIEGNAVLIVDVGNSSTKCTVHFGTDKSGRPRERSFELSNEFALISENYNISSDYTEENSAVLNVDVTLANKARVVGTYCNGDLQRKEKSLAVIKPSAITKKWLLPSTVLSLSLAFYRAHKEVLAITGAGDIKDMDINWNVICLLPPGDLELGEGASDKPVGQVELEKLIRQITQVNMILPEVKLPIKLDKVFVLPEGYCAYAGVVYDKGLKVRNMSKYLMDETVLIIDIGAGTTDCLVIRKNVLVQNSKYTITQGGNNVYQAVCRELRLLGLDLPTEEIREGILKGYVKDGTKKVSIVDVINKAKSDVAQKIISAFQDFIEATDTKMRSIGYVLVCGGGAMDDSEAKDVKPLSEAVEANLKTLAPNCQSVVIPEIGTQVTNEDGSVDTVYDKISLRWLNLVGASVLSEALVRRA